MAPQLMTTLLQPWSAASMPMLGKALPWTLAAASGSSRSQAPMSEIVLYSGMIVVGIIFLIFIAMKTRSWLLNAEEESSSGDFFSISQLRQLRDDGLLSEEEYERAKRVLVAQGLSMLNSSHAPK